MNVRTMSSERLYGLTARFLAGASLLVVVALGLVIRSSWLQTTQSLSVDESVTDALMPLEMRLLLVMFDVSYRQLGGQVLLSTAFVAAAVAVLHRHPSWRHVSRLRWEVLGAGIVVLVADVGLALAHLQVLTNDESTESLRGGYVGRRPETQLAVSNLTMLGAALLILVGASLWWLRLEAPQEAVESDAEADGSDADEGLEGSDSEDRTEVSDARNLEQRPAPITSAHASSDNLSDNSHDVNDSDDLSVKGYPRDWSPEDFQRPTPRDSA